MQIDSTEHTSFNEQLYKLTQDIDANLHVTTHKILEEDELVQLGQFIETQKPFPITKLSLFIDLKTLNNPQLLACLQQLNSTLIAGVELVFSAEDVQQSGHEISDVLTNSLAAQVSYPLQIREAGSHGIVPAQMELSTLQNTVIANIQKRNKDQYDVPVSDESVSQYKRTLDSTDPMAKKIKLKELIKKRTVQEGHLTQYIPLEIQHVETVEQELVQQVQEVIEVQQNLELHEIQEYGGQLLGFEEFNTPLYKNKVVERTGDESAAESLYSLLKQELFANLPHAIKYISPDAAEHLAADLPRLVSLNKDNLPDGFILKQTGEGELVLDYDPHLENEQSNPFTPVESELEYTPIYNIEIKEQDVRHWVDDEQLFAILWPAKAYTTPKQLINMWIKHGNEGVTSFFNDLKRSTQSQPYLIHDLLTCYLSHLPQWAHLYNNKSFFTCLERISHFDEQKQACLKKFLIHTGSSQHDLSKTVTAFEVFWGELTLLCAEQKVPIAGINSTDWSTPRGGNPVVYMERMLFILKNARSLSDQFKLLEGITLDNYGAYYASRFEDFKAVSAEMHLTYKAEAQNKQPYNKHYNVYRVDLESLAEPYAHSQRYSQLTEFASYYRDEDSSPYWLVNCSNELPQPLNLEQLKSAGLVIPFERKAFVPPYHFYKSKADGSMDLLFSEKPKIMTKFGYYAMSYRFLGMQKSGITVSTFRDQFEEFKKGFWGEMNLSGELLAVLFFISHERFIDGQPLLPILTSLNHASIHKEVINDSINLLNKLYKLDIKLNQAEGLMLFESIAGMNSAEFEGLRLNKVDCIRKLLTQFEHNKFAAFKFFDFRTKKSSPKWPFLYALDTADYLAKDPIIAAAYHDDLLLFSGLINSISKEVYHHARFTDELVKNVLTLREEQKLKRSRMTNSITEEEFKRAYFSSVATKDTPAAKIVLGNLEQVKNYLHQAATREKPNNLQYAIQVIINAKNYFTYAGFIEACRDIELIPVFDSKAVDNILRKHRFTVGAELPEIFTKDNADLKGIMISLILMLEETRNKKDSEPTQQNPQEEAQPVASSLQAELASLSIAELQIKLKKSWEEAGTLLSITGQLFLGQILKTTKDLAIKSAFETSDAEGLLKVIAGRINNLSDFQDYGDFEKVNKISAEAEKIADLFKQTLKNPYVIEHEKEFISLFKRVDFSKIDYETLYGVLSLLTTMPQRNYLSLLSTFFADKRFIGNKERVVELLHLLTALNNSYFPSEYLDAFSKLVIANSGEKEFSLIMAQMVTVYDKDNKDPILELILSHPELSYKQVSHMLNVSEGVEHNRDKISTFLMHLMQIKKLDIFLNQITDLAPDAQKNILAILSKGHGLNRITEGKNAPVNYSELVALLTNLPAEALGQLHAFYKTTPVSAECLMNALKQPGRTKEFSQFLLEFEKAPFGERDLQKQFSCAEVERVINQSKDLINNSIYTYQYRKQLMEAFLFVNAIGEQLPVYNNKPTRELTNAEIKSFFVDLKEKRNASLTPFQSRLLALGLMRETMYRSTGEFPYSTQVIALIDGMMHQGDFISNIDTGQGKSLVDSMKAALLWLESDRVDLTTSSLVDAKRDIANYGTFLKSLGIPYSEAPITSVSPMGAFQQNGINFSTFAQLSLFFAKAKVIGVALDTPETVVSLVANESDYTILDDRVIYRFASADGSGVNYGQEWIYYGINEFVARPEFINNDKTTAEDDVADLKAYLKIKARELKKSGKIVNKFSDAQYLSWLESALTVNYILKENDDYVIPDEFEKKVINGAELRSKVVKVLMKDKKVSQDSTFGNGIQQLLYARLNADRQCADFVIEPQNKTIISTNNKNLIDYYRAKKGFIWGSSGTVGSRAEILEQYSKYGFVFSQAEPHQQNKVQFNEPIIEADEQAQFKKLISLLTGGNPNNNSAPSIVFCKDINTAIRLFKELGQHHQNKFPMQLYTGLGKEEDYINKASQPGMITITTSALGRNTDIHYDKIKGLRVWHTFVDSTRGSGQKSGRTGRQGSAGEVNYVLNAKELGNKTIKDIREELDKRAAFERSVNERLYNVLGYLLLHIDYLPEEQFIKGKSAFLREQWARFSSEAEAQFREMELEVVDDNDDFTAKTLVTFNQILGAAVKTPVTNITPDSLRKVVEQIHPNKAKYTPYTKEVKLTDCVPPVTIAYHLLHVESEDHTSETTSVEIKAKLAQLFKQITKGTFAAKNSDYLRYLQSKPATQEVIVEAHKEFLTQFLQDNSKKLNIIERWFGYEGKLNQIARNENYLLMFHAFSSIPNTSGVGLPVIKQAVNTLIDEYLETSWFISSERKKWALEIKVIISTCEDIDTVIHCLSNAKIEVARQDIATNKDRFWKPLHFSGHSRYQSTLTRALNLAASLSAKTDLNELTSGLTPLMSEVTDNTPVIDLTLDELKHRTATSQRDKGNASVLIESLEQALTITNRKDPAGMLGRKGFFSTLQEDLKTPDETDSTKQLAKK